MILKCMPPYAIEMLIVTADLSLPPVHFCLLDLFSLLNSNGCAGAPVGHRVRRVIRLDLCESMHLRVHLSTLFMFSFRRADRIVVLLFRCGVATLLSSMACSLHTDRSCISACYLSNTYATVRCPVPFLNHGLSRAVLTTLFTLFGSTHLHRPGYPSLSI